MGLLCFTMPNGRNIWIRPSEVRSVTPVDHKEESQIRSVDLSDTRQMSRITIGGSSYVVLDPDDTVGSQIAKALEVRGELI